MSPRLPRVTAAELLRALYRDGWYDSRQSGSHLVLRHPTKPQSVAVPRHSGKTLRLATLASILDSAELTPEDLRRLL
jgi:predicted RNA binding protein YcfA (HicA-like mRNA interferase family)